jgi:hypothetical protein
VTGTPCAFTVPITAAFGFRSISSICAGTGGFAIVSPFAYAQSTMDPADAQTGDAVPVDSDTFFRILNGLLDVETAAGSRYSSFNVRGKRFGYYWPRTQTVGLKQTLSEQKALVSERPEVFEEQFTMGGFGWVVVYLAGVEADELAELVFEAWRLSAPEELVAAMPDPANS